GCERRTDQIGHGGHGARILHLSVDRPHGRVKITVIESDDALHLLPGIAHERRAYLDILSPERQGPGLGAGLVMLSVVRFSWEYSENTRLREQRDELLGIAIGKTALRRTTEQSQLGRAQSGGDMRPCTTACRICYPTSDASPCQNVCRSDHRLEVCDSVS